MDSQFQGSQSTVSCSMTGASLVEGCGKAKLLGSWCQAAEQRNSIREGREEPDRDPTSMTTQTCPEVSFTNPLGSSQVNQDGGPA